MSRRHLEAKAFGLTLVPANGTLSLTDSLAALGIPVFDTNSVNRYKKKALRRVKRPILGPLCFLYFAFAVVFTAVEFGNAFNLAVVSLFGANVPDASVSMITARLWVGLLAIISSLMLLKAFFPRPYPAWRCSTFNHYRIRNSVPAAIQDRAVLAQRSYPDATLHVDWLYEDPFLWIVSEGQSAYIGVWDEKGFA